MSDVCEILNEWGLSELTSTFKENEVTGEAFDCLTDETIKELIPKVGPRVIFMKRYAVYKALTTDDVSFTADTVSIASPSTPSRLSPSTSDLEDTSVVYEQDQISDLEMTQDERENTPCMINKQKTQQNRARPVNLREMLESSSRGKMILSSYAANNKLDVYLQNKLVEMIIDNEIGSGDTLDKRIPVERFEMLTNEIVGLFPREIKEIYFSYVRKRKHDGSICKVGNGKLFRRYYNCRRNLRKKGLLPKIKHVKSDPRVVNETVEDLDLDEQILWLKNSTKPWSEIARVWESTFSKRAAFRSKNVSMLDYVKTFPALQLQLGYTLLENDFKKLYPDIETNMFSNFSIFSEKILQYARGLKHKEVDRYLTKIEDGMRTDVYNICVLSLLPLLLKPTVVKKMKGGGYWKPSKLEVSEGFLLHVKIPGEIKPSLERKRNKLAAFGLTLQPTPVVVGDDLLNIGSSYVAIEDVLYNVPTPLKAVDVCFKTIHALDACYPQESEQVWMLIQRGVYHLTTPWDRQFMAVETILRDL